MSRPSSPRYQSSAIRTDRRLSPSEARGTLKRNGIDCGFGLVAVILTLAGSAAGTLLAGCWMLGLGSEEAAFADIVFALTPGLITQIYIGVLTPMNLAWYGVAVAAAYWLGIRRIRRDEMAMCAVDEQRTNEQSDTRAA